MRTHFVTLACGAALLAGVPRAAAQEEAGAPDEAWRFELRPMLWAPIGISGDVAVGDIATPVDVSFGDVVDTLELLVGLRLQAWWGALGMTLELNYEQLGADETVEGEVLDLTSHQVYGDLLFGVQLFEWSRKDVAGGTSVGLAVGGGPRVLWNRGDLTLGAEAEVEDQVRVEGVLEATLPVRLGPRWGVTLLGEIKAPDVGGSILGFLQYDVGRVGFQVGYRHEWVNRSDERLALDLTVHGPYLGVALRFGENAVRGAGSAAPVSLVEQ